MENKKKKDGRGSNPNSRKNLKPIKKGEVRNPDGGRAHDADLRALKMMTSEDLKWILDVLFKKTVGELEIMAKDKDMPGLRAAATRHLFNGISKGDWDLIEKLLARTIGRVTEKVDMTSNGQTMNAAPFVVEFVDA